MLLLSAALGLALSSAASAVARLAAALYAAISIAIALTPLASSWEHLIFTGALLSTVATACLTCTPLALSRRWLVAVAVNDAVWLGALASMSRLPRGLVIALPLLLLCVPGGWLIARGYGVAVKVVASWVVAIAALAFFVSLVPTPGYEPDHME